MLQIMEKEHYYIDGYNLLFALIPLDENLQEERQAMIQDLGEKIQFLHLDATLVFDSTYQNEEGSRSHISDLEIVYTDYQETADDYIVNQVSIANQPHREIVVTADRELAWRVKQQKGKAISAIEFVKWLNKRYHKKKEQPKKVKIVESSSEKKSPDATLDRYLTAFQQEPEKERPRKLSDQERWLEIFEKKLKELDSS